MTRDRKLHLVEVYRDKWEIPDLIKESKDIYNQWASNLGNRQSFAKQGAFVII